MELIVPIVLIIAGVGLIFAEVYLVPGLNVIGIAGGLLMFFAIGYAFSESGTPGGFLALGLAVILTGGSFYIMWRSGAWDRFVLSTSLKTEEGAAGRESEQRARYLGKSGLALTPLRPTGIAEIDGERIEVVTEGDFIASGSSIKVVAMDRRRYFVRLSTGDTEQAS